MPVVNVKKSWTKDGNTVSDDLTRLSMQYYEGYTVQTDDPLTNESELVRLAAGIPRPGVTICALNSFAICSDVDVRRVAPTLYELSVRYGYELERKPGEPLQPDPLARFPRFRFYGHYSSEQIQTDAAGALLCNVNGEMIDPPITEEIADEAVQIAVVWANYNPLTMRNYRRTTNSGTVNLYGLTLIPAGQGLMWDITANNFTDTNPLGLPQEYVEVNFTVITRGQRLMSQASRAWWYRYPNVGFTERAAGPTSEPTRIRDSNGDPVPTPQNLSLTGEYLGPNWPTYWIERPRFPSSDWTQIGFA